MKRGFWEEKVMRAILAGLKRIFGEERYLRIRKAVLKQFSKLMKYYLFRVVYPGIYNKHKKLPIQENKVLFIEVRMDHISNSFKILYDQLSEEYSFDIHCHYLRNTFVPRKEYIKRCRALLKDMATAKYVFINESSNVVGAVKLRPETIITQTWHGCGAFKKFGFSTAELIFGETRKEMLKYPYHTNYKYVTVSSPEVVWAYEEAMNLENKNVVVPTGISRTDIFYNDEFIKKAYQKLYSLFPAAKGKKVILYAPTFRGRVAKAAAPDKLNVQQFKEELEGDYVLITKHHPFVRQLPSIPEECSEFAVDFTHKMSIEELIVVSDLCISDYSSLVFEYSLFERPLLFFAYDLEEYFDWRGFYYDYYELTPGPIFNENMEMIEYIKNIDEKFDKQAVIEFRNKFMSACDGHSTERIVNMVFGEALNQYKK